MVSVGVGGFIIIFFYFILFCTDWWSEHLLWTFKLKEVPLGFCSCFLNSWKMSSSRSNCCGQKGMVLLGFGGFALVSFFFLFKWTFIFFFSHDFSLFWLGCSLGLLLGKQHWTCSAEKMINGRQNCIQRAVYLGGTSVQWNTALENSRQMVCEIVDKLPSLSSLNEYFHENIGLISPCII